MSDWQRRETESDLEESRASLQAAMERIAALTVERDRLQRMTQTACAVINRHIKDGDNDGNALAVVEMIMDLEADLAAARTAAHAWKRAAKFWYYAQPDDGGEWERWQEYRYRRDLLKPVSMCSECGVYPADYPSGICAGCEAYHDHLA